MHSDELPVKQYAYLCWPPKMNINYQAFVGCTYIHTYVRTLSFKMTNFVDKIGTAEQLRQVAETDR